MDERAFVNVTDVHSIATVASLARDIWTEYYTPIIGTSQVAYMLDKYQSQNAIERQIREEHYSYYLIRKDDGVFIGYIGVVPRPETAELFLSKLYIMSGERGQGYARKAVRFLAGMAQEKGLEKITLTVNKHNAGTIRAYLKLGFKNRGPLVTDIGNGYVMDDYRMEMALGNG